MRLSKSVADRLPAPERGARLYWDEALKGFGVQVTARGVRAWVVRFRVRGAGRDRRTVLGRTNVLTAEEAREAARRALAADLARAAPGPDAWVFPGRTPDAPIRELKMCWKRLCADAELSGVRIHDLRHTHASALAGTGASLPVIGRVLGHRQHQTTLRYAHLADDPVRRAVEAAADALEAALRSPSGGSRAPAPRERRPS